MVFVNPGWNSNSVYLELLSAFKKEYRHAKPNHPLVKKVGRRIIDFKYRPPPGGAGAADCAARYGLCAHNGAGLLWCMPGRAIIKLSDGTSTSAGATVVCSV